MADEKAVIRDQVGQKNEELFIDLDKVIQEKSPFLKRVLPSFVINYLKRVIQQDRLNYFIREYGENLGLDFIDGVLKDMRITLNLVGLENIPKKEKCIVASNHPLGGLDGLALMLAVGNVRKDILFPVNDLLMNVKSLQPLFIPINKLGSNADNIKVINDTFASDNLVCYFPFGLVSRKRKGVVKDLEWKTTFISKAKRHKRDIIPTYISGRNTNFFYNLANFRKKLGLKMNLEMLYLPDEMIKQEGQTLKITFGPKIPYSFFDKRYNITEWAELMRQYVYVLDKEPVLSFENWLGKKQ